MRDYNYQLHDESVACKKRGLGLAAILGRQGGFA